MTKPFSIDGERIEDIECFEDNACQCPACGGDGEFIGSLGAVDHLRCRYCGMTFNIDTETD